MQRVKYINESKQDEIKFHKWWLDNYDIEDYYDDFIKLRPSLKSPYNDYYYWMKRNPQELVDYIDNIKDKRNSKAYTNSKAKEGAQLIYSDKNWKVYKITSYEAAVKYGKGTKWCISGSKAWHNGEDGEEFFNNYVDSGTTFYFYINSDGNKYALAMYDNIGSGLNYDVYTSSDVKTLTIPNAPSIKGLPNLTYKNCNELWCALVADNRIPLNWFNVNKCIVKYAKDYFDEDMTILDNAYDIYKWVSSHIPDGYLEANNSNKDWSGDIPQYEVALDSYCDSQLFLDPIQDNSISSKYDISIGNYEKIDYLVIVSDGDFSTLYPYKSFMSFCTKFFQMEDTSFNDFALNCVLPDCLNLLDRGKLSVDEFTDLGLSEEWLNSKMEQMFRNKDLTESFNNSYITLYRVDSDRPIGEFDNASIFFTDNLDYYSGSQTGYKKERANTYLFNINNAKVFDPMRELNLDPDTWSVIWGKTEDFDRLGILWENDGYDDWENGDPDIGYTSTDDLAEWGRTNGYDVTVLRDIPNDFGYGKPYTEYAIHNSRYLKRKDIKEAMNEFEYKDIINESHDWKYGDKFIDDGSYAIGTWKAMLVEKQLKEYFEKIDDSDTDFVSDDAHETYYRIASRIKRDGLDKVVVDSKKNLYVVSFGGEEIHEYLRVNSKKYNAVDIGNDYLVGYALDASQFDKYCVSKDGSLLWDAHGDYYGSPLIIYRNDKIILFFIDVYLEGKKFYDRCQRSLMVSELGGHPSLMLIPGNEEEDTSDEVYEWDLNEYVNFCNKKATNESLTESKNDYGNLFKWIEWCYFNVDIPEDNANYTVGTYSPETILSIYQSNKNKFKGKPLANLYYYLSEFDISNNAPKSKMKNRDNYYKFILELTSVYNEKSKKERNKIATDGAEVLYEDTNWVAYAIHNYEASRKFGYGTTWCISSSNKQYWDNYTYDEYEDDETRGKAKFWFILNKKNKNIKFACQLGGIDRIYKIYNAQDNVVPFIPCGPKVDNEDLSKPYNWDVCEGFIELAVQECFEDEYKEEIRLSKHDVNALKNSDSTIEINANSEDATEFLFKVHGPDNSNIELIVSEADTNCHFNSNAVGDIGCWYIESAISKSHDKHKSITESKKDNDNFLKWLKWCKENVDIPTSISQFSIGAKDYQEIYDIYMKNKDRLGPWSKNMYSMMKDFDISRETAKNSHKNADNYSSLIASLSSLPKTKTQRSKEAEEGTELIYEDSNWLVYNISTYGAAKKLGYGSSWCISSSNPEYWDDYRDDNGDEPPFKFVVSKKDRRVKFAVHIVDGGINKIYNMGDDVVPYIPNGPTVDGDDYSEVYDEGILEAYVRCWYDSVQEWIYDDKDAMDDKYFVNTLETIGGTSNWYVKEVESLDVDGSNWKLHIVDEDGDELITLKLEPSEDSTYDDDSVGFIGNWQLYAN